MADRESLMLRRELRRRKILEFSEDRLKKVLGQNPSGTRSEQQLQQQPQHPQKRQHQQQQQQQLPLQQQPTRLEREASPFLKKPPPEESLADGYQARNVFKSKCASSTKDGVLTKPEALSQWNGDNSALKKNYASSRGSYTSENLLAENAYSQLLDDSLFLRPDHLIDESYASPPVRLERRVMQPVYESPPTNTEPRPTSSWVHSLFWRKGAILILACFVQILLFLEVDVKPILIPFMILEVSLILYELCFDTHDESPCPLNFLIGALLLLGLSRRLLSRLNTFLSIVSIVYDDIAFFLFSFCVSHWLIKSEPFGLLNSLLNS